MKLKIEITEYDNAAMADSPAAATAGILQEIQQRIETSGLDGADGMAVRDHNGNRVGTVTLSASAEERAGLESF